MAQRKSAIESLKKVRDAEHRQAQLALKRSFDKYESATSRFEMLDNYLSEYHQTPLTSLQKGALLSRQSFIENLNVSIQEQKKICIQLKYELEQSQYVVADAFKASRGLEIILEKMAQREREEIDRKDSIILDELNMVRYSAKKQY